MITAFCLRSPAVFPVHRTKQSFRFLPYVTCNFVTNLQLTLIANKKRRTVKVIGKIFTTLYEQGNSYAVPV